jgi:hypothetical protein
VDFPAPDIHPDSPEGLTDGWRTVSLITWIGVFGALLCVAVSSRTIGRPIWWLGPVGNPAPFYFLVIPIVITAMPILATMRRPQHIVRVGWICALALFATALPDFADSPAIAWAVTVIAVAALVETIAMQMVSRHYR